MNNDHQKTGNIVGWQCNQTTPLFESQWYDVRQDQLTLPAGKQITYTYMEHPGATVVVPVTRDQQIILMRSYRYPIDDWCWGVPGGGLGDKNGKSVEDVAREELAEEIGGVAEYLEKLGTFYTVTGVARLQLHYFIGHNVELHETHRREATEVIDSVQPFAIDNVLDMIYKEKAIETESAFAILLAINRLRN